MQVGLLSIILLVLTLPTRADEGTSANEQWTLVKEDIEAEFQVYEGVSFIDDDVPVNLDPFADTELAPATISNDAFAATLFSTQAQPAGIIDNLINAAKPVCQVMGSICKTLNIPTGATLKQCTTVLPVPDECHSKKKIVIDVPVPWQVSCVIRNQHGSCTHIDYYLKSMFGKCACKVTV